MRKSRMVLFLITSSWIAVSAQEGGHTMGAPGCDHLSPQQCVRAALEAMGGSDRLESLKSVRFANRQPHAPDGAILSTGTVHYLV
jgi:hypothetical protein